MCSSRRPVSRREASCKIDGLLIAMGIEVPEGLHVLKRIGGERQRCAYVCQVRSTEGGENLQKDADIVPCWLFPSRDNRARRCIRLNHPNGETESCILVRGRC